MRLSAKALAGFSLGAGILLRLLLFGANPAANAFDNHFKPVFMIMETGSVPAKDACWQCYHPPVFYWISAQAGNLAVRLGATFPQLMKTLQFLPCLYGILTLVLLYLILLKLPLSDFARWGALAAVCFLPRHIYMSAIHSNDTISYLFVSLSVYLLMIAMERNLPPLLLLMTGAVISITLFTKYTSFVVLPAALTAFAVLFWTGNAVPRKRILAALALTLALPLALLTASLASNKKLYGSALPWNVDKQDPATTQPHDGTRMDFFTFKPWESLGAPVILPGKMHSYWTLLHEGMWFDNEPKFLYYLDPDHEAWNHYYGWLKGSEAFPGAPPPMSPLTKAVGSGLIALGLVPLLLMLAGVVRWAGEARSWRSRAPGTDPAKTGMMAALLVATAAGCVALAVRLPVFSAAKASYLLNALPAFAFFLGLGLMRLEEDRRWKSVLAALFGALFLLAGAHVLQIVLAPK
jgi:4-amino-4-deoxy-L-arabinose transferase-like glycosyltransferase